MPASKDPNPDQMADAETPFIRNSWYVIGEASEVGRTPMSRTVLGTSIVLFRTEAGAIVALRNRCCHRSFPLSHGRIDGDTIICGYHGLRYDKNGRCIELPMQKSVPSSIKVHAFPTTEFANFVWIWMGDLSAVDACSPPFQEWMASADWDTRRCYLHVKGSYVHLHENLLDLSHLSFIHASSFGTPEYAKAPVETMVNGNDFQVWRHVECQLPPIYSRPLGWTGMRALRSSGSQFIAPCLHINTGIFRNLDYPELSESAPTIKIAQLITPETTRTTHYWSLQARNFARGDRAMGDFMIEQQLAAFREDVFAIEQITDLEQLEADQEFQQVSIPTDKAGVLMRRRLKQLAGQER